MQVKAFLKTPVGSLLDVGCNVGAWLGDCAQFTPSTRLAGVEINQEALEIARQRVPTAELHRSGAEKLPFADASFDCVTCLDVLEHLPPELRSTAFREMHRVLKPGGRLIMTVPHAGWFAWLDSNNVRLRVPGLYRRLVGEGGRDANYAAMGRKVEWHYHFTVDELKQLAGEGWRSTTVRRGGFLIYPIIGWLSWPFFRLGLSTHPLRRMLERISSWDYRFDYGSASYGVLMSFDRE